SLGLHPHRRQPAAAILRRAVAAAAAIGVARRPASGVAHGVRRRRLGGGRTPSAGHLGDPLDLGDGLAHGGAVGAGLLDAAEGQVDVRLEAGERRGGPQRGVEELVEAVHVLAAVHRLLDLPDHVAAALQRLPRRDHLQQQHAEAVHVAPVRQLLRHVVLRVQVPLPRHIHTCHTDRKKKK
ncbi:Os12g0210450, partial [Oryza sativa Japonica Group]